MTTKRKRQNCDMERRLLEIIACPTTEMFALPGAPSPHPGGIPASCQACKATVWVGTMQQVVLTRSSAALLMCWECAAPLVAAGVPVVEAAP